MLHGHVDMFYEVPAEVFCLSFYVIVFFLLSCMRYSYLKDTRLLSHICVENISSSCGFYLLIGIIWSVEVLNLHIYILASPYLSIKFSLYILQKWTFCYKLLFCGLNSRIYFEFSLYFLTSFLFPVMFIFPVILFFHVIYFHLPE